MTSFLPVDAAIAEAVGVNMATTIDTVIGAVALAGTNVKYGGGKASRNLLTASDKITSALIRSAYAEMRGKSVPGYGDAVAANGVVTVGMGSNYVAMIHPHVAKDLREETGAGGWRQPKEYSDPSGIYKGELGMYEGVRFVENPNAYLGVKGGGASSADVYLTQLFGYQYLGEGVGVEPELRITGPFDGMGRLLNVAWYALVGYARVREEAGVRIESGGSIALP